MTQVFAMTQVRPAIVTALTTLLALGTLLAAGPPPAVAQTPLISPISGAPPAPSALTISVLAKARPLTAFLARASRLAQRQARSRNLRAVAQRILREAPASLAALDAAAAPVIVTADPLDTAAAAANGISAAAETILSVLPRPLRTPGARAIAADRAISGESEAVLAQLAALEGSAFDALYAASAHEALSRLAGLYRDYTQNGDEQALLAITVPRLRQVNAELAALRPSMRD